MKRGTIVALVILVLLGLVYVMTSSEPPTSEKAPMTVSKVEGLSRIEITPAKGSGGSADAAESGGAEKPERIALEKRDGSWWVVEPLESPAAESVQTTIEEAFGGPIETDDLPIPSSKAANFKVDAAQGVGLALYGKDKSSPAVELTVGKQLTVESTEVERTFIRRAGNDSIYRAQVALGAFVRQSVDDLRSNRIVDIDKKGVQTLTWTGADGTDDIVLEKGDDGWSVATPEADWGLDSAEVDGIVGALGGLTASGFAEEKSLEEIGLEPPTTTLTVTTKEGETSLLLGQVGQGSGATYYAKLSDKPFKYKLSRYAGKKLLADVGDIRSKTPYTIDKKAITAVQFPGGDGVRVKKVDGSWRLVAPASEEELNSSKFESRLGKIASLRVKGFPDVAPAEAGLTGGADRVVVTTSDGREVLMLGGTVDEKSGDRYVTFEGSGEVYTVAGHVAGSLTPTVDDVTGESKGRPGMGRGRGGGMKGMPPGAGQKMRRKMMMQKMIQQKMRQQQR